MQFKMQQVEDIMVMIINGKLLSEQETVMIRENIITELNAGRRKFIFDLDGLDFVNSAYLNFLVSSKNLISAKDGRLVLCNVPEQLKKLLTITKLESFFSMAGRTKEALEMLHKS